MSIKLFIVDTEATGLTENEKVCEVAATLYQIGDTKQETGAIASISTLLPVITNDAEHINGIAPELTQLTSVNALNLAAAFTRIIWELALTADYAIAFNAEFDAPLVNQLLKPELDALELDLSWLCAMKDFNWGYPNVKANGSFKLVDLCLWMGIGISTAHRAADDVRLLVECLNRHPSPMAMVEKAIARAASPVVEIRALVSYDDRELAKTAGFIWDGSRRYWTKKLRECDMADLVFPFGIVMV